MIIGFNPDDGSNSVFADNNFVGNNGIAIQGGGELGEIGGHGNFLAGNNGATTRDTTTCPLGIIGDGNFTTSSSTSPQQFRSVDGCRAMATAPVNGVGPTSN